MIKVVKEMPLAGTDKPGLYWNEATEQMLCLDTQAIWYLSGKPEDFEVSEAPFTPEGIQAMPVHVDAISVDNVVKLFDAASRLSGR